MDDASPSPIKRPRLSDSLATHPESSKHLQKTKVVRMKLLPNNDTNISNSLQKLKLKSSDGRDLGEIKVKLFPKKQDAIGGKTIVLKKHSLFNRFENSSAVSLLKPVDQTTPTSVNLPSFGQSTQSAGTITRNGNKCVSFSTVRTIRAIGDGEAPTTVLNVSQKINPEPVAMVMKHPIATNYSPPASSGSNVFVINVPKQNDPNNMINVTRHTRNLTPIRPKPQILQASNNNVFVIEGQNTNMLDTNTVLHSSILSKDVTGSKSAFSTSNTGNQKSVSFSSAKFLELSSKLTNRKARATVYEIPDQSITLKKGKLYNNNQPSSIQPKKSIYKSIAPITTTLRNKPIIESRSWTIIKTYGKKSPNSTKSNDNSQELPTNNTESPTFSQTKCTVQMIAKSKSESTQNVTSTTSNSTDNGKVSKPNVLRSKTGSRNDVQEIEENSDTDQNSRKNIKVSSPENVATSQNSKKGSTEARSTCNEAMSMEIDDGTIDAGIPTRDSNLSNSDKCNRQDDMDSTAATKLQEIDIIQKALSTLTDKDLREKALEALAKCGIGIKRDVPIPPTKSVCDSISQTTVFSLLKPENMLEYDVNFPNLTTLKVCNGNEMLLQQLNDDSSAPSTNFVNTTLGSYSSPYLPPIDFDNLLIDLLPECPAPKVAEIRDILSKPNPVIEPTINLLKRDYEAATTSDHNGLMGIHRAVLSGNIKEVKRHMIVLRALKESIDVQTDDRMTSLELAVTHEVDSSIVRLLLEEGAKPVFEMKLHESALIIASRTSSSVLPELISHVNQPHLLNNVDIEGYTPLHYCTQEDNFNGVKLLISAGADVNLRDSKSGRSPLFHALEKRHIQIAFHLLDNGALPSLTNFAGQSPAALVDEYKQNLLAEKLNRAPS